MHACEVEPESCDHDELHRLAAQAEASAFEHVGSGGVKVGLRIVEDDI